MTLAASVQYVQSLSGFYSAVVTTILNNTRESRDSALYSHRPPAALALRSYVFDVNLNTPSHHLCECSIHHFTSLVQLSQKLDLLYSVRCASKSSSRFHRRDKARWSLGSRRDKKRAEKRQAELRVEQFEHFHTDHPRRRVSSYLTLNGGSPGGSLRSNRR